ncbi:MAG TPA: RNA methyltransferase [Opitutaceae bacterium]|jgi:TrmH RNA methyltransferase
MRPGEFAICGLPAVRARFRRSPESIQKLFFDFPTSKKVGILCRTLASLRKVYRCVEAADLEKLSGSMHHGGIVAIVHDPAPASPTAQDAASWARRGECLVALDRIGNAHNLGAIARTAGYFGIPRILISGDPASARPGTAAYRVAEGGLEALEVRITEDLAQFLGILSAAGFEVVGAAARGGRHEAPVRSPWALVLGNEEEGLSPAVAAACTRLVTIAGSGKVESLNVSAAAAVLIHGLAHSSSKKTR